MDSCLTEIVTLITEFACADDFGETARRVGFVSKFFRAIAEPIELRAIAVSGIKQLEGVKARLESARISTATGRPGRTKIRVQHLFISELTEAHALAADTCYPGDHRSMCTSFWRTEEGRAAKAYYNAHTDAFWRVATDLVRIVSENLKTLSLLADDKFRYLLSASMQQFRHSVSQKVLGAISGLAFPNLITLTVNHNAAADLSCSNNDRWAFKSPETPQLRKLCIDSPISLYLASQGEEFIHPLLRDLQHARRELTHLVLCHHTMPEVEVALKAAFGEKWSTSQYKRTLPLMLRSVILQQGIVPQWGSAAWDRKAKRFVQSVQHLAIDGLEAHPHMLKFPGPGRRRYELLLAGWKEESSR